MMPERIRKELIDTANCWREQRGKVDAGGVVVISVMRFRVG